MLKEFFMSALAANISADVSAFLSTELAKIKKPSQWKAELFDQLARIETCEPACVAVSRVKAEALNKFNTICGYTLADLMLNCASPNQDYLLNEEFLTVDALTEALGKASEIVMKSDRYDDSNFVGGFLENSKEMLWTMLCKAATAEKLKSEVKADETVKQTENQMPEPPQQNTETPPEEPGTPEPPEGDGDCDKCKSKACCEAGDLEIPLIPLLFFPFWGIGI